VAGQEANYGWMIERKKGGLVFQYSTGRWVRPRPIKGIVFPTRATAEAVVAEFGMLPSSYKFTKCVFDS
jgi:hypothetical protein